MCSIYSTYNVNSSRYDPSLYFVLFLYPKVTRPVLVGPLVHCRLLLDILHSLPRRPSPLTRSVTLATCPGLTPDTDNTNPTSFLRSHTLSHSLPLSDPPALPVLRHPPPRTSRCTRQFPETEKETSCTLSTSQDSYLPCTRLKSKVPRETDVTSYPTSPVPVLSPSPLSPLHYRYQVGDKSLGPGRGEISEGLKGSGDLFRV